MDILNRMASVKKLRTNACQKYLSYVLVDNWQEKLYKIIEEEIKKFPNSYTHARRKMRTIGITKYTPYNMDITIINAIIVYQHKKLLKSIQQETIDAFLQIKDDKNLTSHADDNEDALELYRQSFLFLSKLQAFIITVDEKEDKAISDEDRQSYLQEYDSKITNMQKTIDKERIESIQQKTEIDNDIQLILGSKDSIHTWLDVNKKYLNDMALSKNSSKYIAFVCEAAKAGIISSYPLAAEYYYKTAKDYDMAEKYLSHLFLNEKEKRYDNPYMLWLANIYLNKLSQTSGDINSIINRLINDGFIVEKTDDGKEYTIVKKITKPKDLTKQSLSPSTEPLTKDNKDLKENRRKNESSSSLERPRKSELAVGRVSGSKKMRLGRTHKRLTDSSSTTEQPNKTRFTVGEISESKKMRLGRVHKKNADTSSTTEQS